MKALAKWLAAPAHLRELGLQSCLNRIRELDASIQAWVQVQPQPPTGNGALSGIPIGIKDIFETEGLATEYGSPIYKGRVGTADAAIVRELRARGAIVLGKTHTAAFAYRTPAPTCNPHDLARTPGGSSSGSAAAVAAGMVPLALGTQTKGSVLRPASYCGVTGFKPSYGLLPMEGVLPFAKSLDTVGFFTHTPADMLAFWDALGHAAGPADDIAFGAAERTPNVEPAMAEAFQHALTQLREAGAVVRSIDIAGMLAQVSEAAETVMFFEGARVHEERYRAYGDQLADIADVVRVGLRISSRQYEDAQEYLAEERIRMAGIFEDTPIILTPAATGPAPVGLKSTGDPRMNAPWTALGTPAISVPMPVPEGLPLGVQLTADRGQDAKVLRAAVRVHELLHETGTL